MIGRILLLASSAAAFGSTGVDSGDLLSSFNNAWIIFEQGDEAAFTAMTNGDAFVFSVPDFGLELVGATPVWAAVRGAAGNAPWTGYTRVVPTPSGPLTFTSASEFAYAVTHDTCVVDTTLMTVECMKKIINKDAKTISFDSGDVDYAAGEMIQMSKAKGTFNSDLKMTHFEQINFYSYLGGKP